MNPLVITTNGIRGACACAVVLAQYPEATLQISSAASLPSFLEQLMGEETLPRHIHICGIVPSEPQRIQRLLKRLARQSTITWYGCRSQDLDKHAPLLEAACTVALGDGPSSAHVIAECLHRRKQNAALEFILELAADYCEGGAPRSSRHELWRDIILASNEYYYLSGDDRFNEAMLRNLAKGKSTKALEVLAANYARRADKTFGMRGFSPATKDLRRNIGQLGPLPGPVLVQGPTGSGKELVAWGLHVRSERDGEFIAINCAVLGGNPQLAADELFGHVKGAFTGANVSRKGAFEQADKGTLFLDEVGELPLEVQAQLLRVLEEKKIVALGGAAASAHKVDVRIVAATHQPLLSMVREGKFREDLYYRLSVFVVEVPPLCARPDDMRSIARLALKEPQAAGFDLQLTEEDWEAADAYDWPGNIRQFIHLVRRAAYLKEPLRDVIAKEQAMHRHGANFAYIETRDLAATTTRRKETEMDASLKPAMEEKAGGEAVHFPERPAELQPAADVYAAYIKHAYQVLGQNVTRTAKTLGVSPNTVKKYLGPVSE